MIKTYIVDSFTNEAFKVNPTGVSVLSKDISDESMNVIDRSRVQGSLH